MSTNQQQLNETITTHLEKIETEHDRFRELMDGRDPAEGPFDWRHTENVANRLHNFYMGIEHIFERIAKVFDGGVPGGDKWHKSLLKQMTESTEHRPAVIDDELRAVLLKYLKFRHFARRGYVVDLEWSAMVGLVESFEQDLVATTEAIENFVSQLDET